MAHDLIRLSSDRGEAWIAPTGGRLVRYRSRLDGDDDTWLSWIDADQTPDSSFPMVPFVSRIRNAQFRFEGQLITLRANNPPEPHAIHGHGFQRRWQVAHDGAHGAAHGAAQGAAQDASSVTLRLDHAAGLDGWPWHYRADQYLSLRPCGSLHLRLTLTNRSSRSMPFGLGYHPYFLAVEDLILQTQVSHLWQMDDEVLPQGVGEVPESMPLERGFRLGGNDIDTVFSGWSGAVLLKQPSAGYALNVRANTSHLVLYTSAEGHFVCAEPVTHVTDAFNMQWQEGGEIPAIDPGARVLAPAASVSLEISFEPVKAVSTA